MISVFFKFTEINNSELIRHEDDIDILHSTANSGRFIMEDICISSIQQTHSPLVNNAATSSSDSISNVQDQSDITYNPNNSTNSDTLEKSTENTLSEESSLQDNSRPIDIRKLLVPVASSSLSPETRKKKGKQHFCPFCKTLQTKFARHLALKHKNEQEVKKFLYLSKGNLQRKRMIAAIRKKGDYLHNTQSELNTGILIVPRQQQKSSKNSAEDYMPCKNCKIFLSKKSIRFHIPYCDMSRVKGTRNIISTGKRLCGYIHESASETLRRIVFPVLTDDIIVRSIKFDQLIITFGNKLCEKYTLTHQHDHIRAQLRLLGRLKIELMLLDKDITEFSEAFSPRKFDVLITAIKRVASWNPQIMWYDHPSVAQNLTTLIKKCANKLRVDYMKQEDYEKKSSVENFLILWNEEVPVIINKKALEDQITQKRHKKVILPSKSDIKLLYDYLKKESYTCLKMLSKEFDNNAWLLLSQCTLILLQIFNRRRAGEIERLTLSDYKNQQSLNENVDPDIYRRLSDSTRKFASQFVRLTLRGKLGRTVSVLLSPLLVECIETMLKYRRQAGVRADNEYVFSKPHTSKLSKKYIRACPLMKRFSNECGALLPSALRGTALRKHIATYTAMLNVEESQVDRLATFMGHHKDIHKNVYRVPVPVAEITDVSRLLMAAIGEDDVENGDENEEQDSDSSDEEVNVGVAAHKMVESKSDHERFKIGTSNNGNIIFHYRYI